MGFVEARDSVKQHVCAREREKRCDWERNKERERESKRERER